VEQDTIAIKEEGNLGSLMLHAFDKQYDHGIGSKGKEGF
jgi:hypothetical protein